jgi:hypothetical protein
MRREFSQMRRRLLELEKHLAKEQD